MFAFASRNQGAAGAPAISARFEESLLPEYLAFGYVSGERTLFRGIRKLMPGHHLTLDLDARQAAPAHRAILGCSRPAARIETRRRAAWIAECRERLEETVRMRLMSDVPLGMFLSGGVDSSAIAALMKRMVRRAGEDLRRRLQRRPNYSELDYAAPGGPQPSAPNTTKSSSAWRIFSTPCPD